MGGGWGGGAKISGQVNNSNHIAKRRCCQDRITTLLNTDFIRVYVCIYTRASTLRSKFKPTINHTCVGAVLYLVPMLFWSCMF